MAPAAMARLLVIVGPCSIHDPKAGLEYATKLRELVEAHKDDLVVVMRVYFEPSGSTPGSRRARRPRPSASRCG